MIGDPEPNGPVTMNASVGSRMAGRLRRAWATPRGRRLIVIAAGSFIAVITLVIVVVLFASLADESQSFRDGYSAGGSAYTSYAAYSSGNVTAEQACTDEESGPGGRPSRDNSAQWIQGCVDAFNLAESGN